MYSLIFAIGVLTGSMLTYLITKFIRKNITVGTLKCDYSDPDSGPYLFLELEHGGMRMIETNKHVVFEVDLSHK